MKDDYHNKIIAFTAESDPQSSENCIVKLMFLSEMPFNAKWKHSDRKSLLLLFPSEKFSTGLETWKKDFSVLKYFLGTSLLGAPKILSGFEAESRHQNPSHKQFQSRVFSSNTQQDMRSPSKWTIFQLWQAASCCPYCCLPRKSLEMVRKYSTFKSWKIFFSDHHNYFRKWSSRTISYFCLNLLETVFQGTGSIGLRMKIFWFSKALSYLL